MGENVVAVLNHSSVVSDGDLHKMVHAWNAQMTQQVAPLWGRIPWTCHVGGRGYVHHLIVDTDTDVPNALAFHDLGKDGHPVLVTMAKTVLDAGYTMLGSDGVAAAGSHENIEAFIDPYCNDTTAGPDGKFRWHEACDATQGMDYKAPGTDVYVSNFCLPHWFNPNSPDSNVDYQRALSTPFQVGPHGYQVVSECGNEQQVGGRIPAKLIDADGNQVDGGPNAWRTLLLTGI